MEGIHDDLSIDTPLDNPFQSLPTHFSKLSSINEGNMDDATTDVVLTLQLQDLLNIQAGEATDEDAFTDYKVALDIYREELRSNAAVLSDHRYGEKLGRADGVHSEPISPQITATPSFDRLLVQTAAQPTDEDGEPSEEDFSCSSQESATVEICIACGDESLIRDLITAPCAHHYCKHCLSGLFEHSIRDESLFPPRCCRQPIPIDIAKPILTWSTIQDFEQKSVEYSTACRTYCYDARCAAFIPPDKITGEKATCGECDLITCTICQSAAHEDDCPNDPAYEALLTTAKDEGYQRCYQCRRLVELNTGCNHIT